MDAGRLDFDRGEKCLSKDDVKRLIVDVPTRNVLERLSICGPSPESSILRRRKLSLLERVLLRVD